jgi:hypothetical protein
MNESLLRSILKPSSREAKGSLNVVTTVDPIPVEPYIGKGYVVHIENLNDFVIDSGTNECEEVVDEEVHIDWQREGRSASPVNSTDYFDQHERVLHNNGNETKFYTEERERRATYDHYSADEWPDESTLSNEIVHKYRYCDEALYTRVGQVYEEDNRLFKFDNSVSEYTYEDITVEDFISPLSPCLYSQPGLEYVASNWATSETHTKTCSCTVCAVLYNRKKAPPGTGKEKPVRNILKRRSADSVELTKKRSVPVSEEYVPQPVYEVPTIRTFGRISTSSSTLPKWKKPRTK